MYKKSEIKEIEEQTYNDALGYNNFCSSININPVSKVNIENFCDYKKLSSYSYEDRITAAVKVLMDLIVEQDDVEKIDRNYIDLLIAKIDETISKQIDLIIHHPEFQELESSWLSLKHLVDKIDFESNIKLNLLDISKENLVEDFEESIDILQSGLYKHIYDEEYDTPGGEPIAAIISNYEFDSSNKDIELLKNIAKVASSSHCPFIGNVGFRFFYKDSMEEVSKISNIKEYMEKAEFIQWNDFRESEDSRYIGLVMPKFLLRLPYGIENPVKSFIYNEEFSLNQHSKYLWGNASFAFAANLATSFKNHGWSVNIRGPEGGGKVDNLILHRYNTGYGFDFKIPTEILISETREIDLADLGFIPLSYYKGKSYACFFSANSTQKSQAFDSVEATANSKINSRLPYIFLASRLGHYLKVIQRENIGVAKDKAVLEKELNKWISGLVTQMPNPGQELIAKRPLKEGKVIVEDMEDNPGFYRISMYAMPHFQVEGINVKLSLVAKMPTIEAG